MVGDIAQTAARVEASGARSRNAVRLSISWLTAMRSAWKVRVAGWIARDARAGRAFDNRAHFRRGRQRTPAPASTIARAIRRAACSSPNSR